MRPGQLAADTTIQAAATLSMGPPPSPQDPRPLHGDPALCTGPPLSPRGPPPPLSPRGPQPSGKPGCERDAGVHATGTLQGPRVSVDRSERLYTNADSSFFVLVCPLCVSLGSFVKGEQ